EVEPEEDDGTGEVPLVAGHSSRKRERANGGQGEDSHVTDHLPLTLSPSHPFPTCAAGGPSTPGPPRSRGRTRARGRRRRRGRRRGGRRGPRGAPPPAAPTAAAATAPPPRRPRRASRRPAATAGRTPGRAAGAPA